MHDQKGQAKNNCADERYAPDGIARKWVDAQKWEPIAKHFDDEDMN